MKNWNYFFDPNLRDASINMAIDEVLLTNIHKFNTPIFNFYFWKKAGFTCGFSQNREVINEYKNYINGQSDSRRIFLTRRITGGGIVPHGSRKIDNESQIINSNKNINDQINNNKISDLTLGIIIPKNHAIANDKPRILFSKIHEAIAKSLNKFLNVNLKLYKESSDITNNTKKNKEVVPKECFTNPVENDVIYQNEESDTNLALNDFNLNKKKIVGSAQKRTREGILTQTSIQNLIDVDLKLLSDNIVENLLSILNISYTQIDRELLPQWVYEISEKLASSKYSQKAWRFDRLN